MALNNDIAQREALKRAMRLAEIRAEDSEDMETCVNDLVKTAGLDEESARIVAAAYRESMLPEVLEEEGFDRSEFDNAPGNMTANFADEDNATPEMEDEDMEPEMDSDDSTSMEDGGEVNDDNVATLEVEVPADKVDDFLEVLKRAVAEEFGPGAVAEETSEEGDESSMEEDTTQPMDEQETMPKMANRKVKQMSRSARAQREAILASLAGNTRTASDFEYADDVQYEIEGEFPTMTMQGSEGNSLREQNPTFAKQDVPTMNPELLGLKNELSGVKKEGSPEDSSMYEANFDLFTGVPSEGLDPDFNEFEVPTQMQKSQFNLVTASNDSEAAEEYLYNELVSNGVEEDVIANMTFAEGLELYRRINASKVDTLKRMAIDQITISEEDEPKVEAYGMTPSAEAEKEPDEEDKETAMVDGKKAAWADVLAENELFKARLKTAYGVSTKLCLAGLISPDEVEANVDLWLNDGLTVKAMLASGAQMLRMSQTAEQRVASAHAESNIRTAGVATIPGFSGASNNVSTDLQQALKSIFSKPEFEG